MGRGGERVGAEAPEQSGRGGNGAGPQVQEGREPSGSLCSEALGTGLRAQEASAQPGRAAQGTGTGTGKDGGCRVPGAAGAPYVDLFRHFHPHARDVFTVWDQRTDARPRNEGQRCAERGHCPSPLRTATLSPPLSSSLCICCSPFSLPLFNYEVVLPLCAAVCRMDYTICSRGLLPYVVDAQVMSTATTKAWSDHAPVSMTLRLLCPHPSPYPFPSW